MHISRLVAEHAFPYIPLEVSQNKTKILSFPQIGSGTTNAEPLVGLDLALFIPQWVAVFPGEGSLILSKAGWARLVAWGEGHP